MVRLELGFSGLRQFESGFAGNLAEDGLFVPCDAPLAPSTIVRLRIVLAGDVLLLAATGVVFWTRTAADSAGPPGMAVRFVSMAAEFEHTVRELVEARRRRGVPVLQLDRPTSLHSGAAAPWEAPEVGYTLRVVELAAEDGAAVRQLSIFPEEELATRTDGSGRGRKDARRDNPVPGTPATPADAPETGPEAPATAPETVPGTAFEVSFFEDDGSPDTTPRLNEEASGPEVTFGDGDEVDEAGSSGASARLRSWLGRLPSPKLMLEIAVILLVLWGTKAVVSRIAARTGGGTSAPAASPTAGTAGTTPTAEATAATPEPAATDGPEATVAVPMAPSIVATPSPTSTPTRASTVTPTAAPTRAARSVPTATSTPRAAVAGSGPGLAVRDVSWRRRDGRTIVSIRTDAAVDPAAVTVAAISGPPRVLVRIRGVSRAFGHPMIKVGTDEVADIRVGYHPEVAPPSLHIVLDLADEHTTLAGQRIDGSLIEIVVAR